jgi:chloramphenicol O-acetyltransferase type A
MADEREPRVVDIDASGRREQFDLFHSFRCPFLGITAPVDITPLRTALKRAGISFTIGWVHTIARAANAVPALRQRLDGERVIEYPVVHPAITVLTESGQFSFCTLPYEEDLRTFASEAARRIDAAKGATSLYTEPDRRDFLFMTAIPWVAFTGFFHPLTLDPADSVPRLAWGRFSEEGGRTTIPLNIQAHHALVDGIHVGAFYGNIEREIERLRTLGGSLPSGRAMRS